MLQVKNLSKSFADHILFHEATFHLNRGERVGLVGRNGHGKTTLFKIIQGEQLCDSGEILFPKNYRIGYLQQHLKLTQANLVEEGSLGLPEGEKDHLYKVEKILFGLGFSKDDLQLPPQQFSGGFQIRLHLAKVLLSQPDLLLLDEPTNYLDILALRWLERFLQNWPTELMVISHDRSFLDRVSTHIMGIHRGQIKKIPGTTMKYYQQLMMEESLHEKTRLNEEKKIQEMEAFIDRFRAKASKASIVQSRVKALEKIERKDKLANIEQLDFHFTYSHCPGKVLMKLEEGQFHYPDSPLLFQSLSFPISQTDRIGIIGKNGRGKSTLLKVLAQELSLTQGQLIHHPSLKIGYFGQTNIDRLNPQLTVEQEIQSAGPDLSISQARGLCGTMLFSGDHSQKKIQVLSGGEKSRVMLGKILATPANLLLLDEPTNHLDLESVESLVEALKEFPGASVMVTHNEMILDELMTKLIVFRKNEVLFFEGSYQDFLQKWGWQEEGEEGGEDGPKDRPTETKGPTLSYKDYKHLKSELVKERARHLNPLKKKQLELEKGIMLREEEVKKMQQELIEMNEKGQGREASLKMKTLNQYEEEIEQLFMELEEVSHEVSDQEKFYQQKMDDLEKNS